MSCERVLIVAGVRVPLLASLDIKQSYKPITGSVEKRAMNGRLFTQRHWRKVETRITGSGWLPAGLDGVNYDQDIDIHCVEPRALTGPSSAFVLPANRRADAGHLPFGYALLGDTAESAPVAMAGDAATVQAHPSATGYMVQWFPILTVSVKGHDADYSRANAGHGWAIEAREV